jgi:hypothetical protein
MKLDSFQFLENLSRKIQVSLKSDKNIGYLNEGRCTFLIMSRSVLLRTRSVSDKSCKQIETHSLCPITFFFRKSCRLWNNWKDIVEPDRTQMTIWGMPLSCWIPTGTNTHSEYVILTAFPHQQWLHERALMLRYTHTAFPVTNCGLGPRGDRNKAAVIFKNIRSWLRAYSVKCRRMHRRRGTVRQP